MIIYLIRSLYLVPLHLARCNCTCAGQWNFRHQLKIPRQRVNDLFVGVHALKWVQLRLHSPLSSTLDGHECSALRPGRSTPGEGISCAHLEGNWVSSRTSLDKHVMLTWNRTTIPWSFIPWTCRITTYGSSIPTQIIGLQLKEIIKSQVHDYTSYKSGSFIRQSRQSHSLYQSHFSRECDLVLPLSIFSVLSFS